MKKFFGALLLTALALTGCIKGDDSYKKYLPVMPGVTIFENSSTQMSVSTQPANAAMRLAILLAEADKQAAASGEKVDFLQVVYDRQNVKDALLGTTTKVEKDDATGDYRITYDQNAQLFGFYFRGTIVVKTGNRALSETTSGDSWVVEYENFKVQAGQNTVLFNGGMTRLYANGDGSYNVELSALDMRIEGASYNSYWSGYYRLRPEGSGIAFSDCDGKDFVVTASFDGDSLYSMMKDGSSTGMSYALTNGKYLNRGNAYTGTVTSQLISNYPFQSFPSAQVRYIFTVVDNQLRATIDYNGTIMEL